ncbi:hypothetical protein RGQ29_022494 [Quercus rubra]|uniref:Uncharacterized protein n=1 Tax=Quercus rubra TaxID=3512 RepID=A0AAN7IPE1_QUERU|nr:hypothetical protein RGQ29_022494 [Quercus rubra]KAK4584830.1 hypothetical protein RGQ29_022494 [Quercus rubra]
MEKLVESYDRECMRMAMLKHEETFKQQVYELHRLYQIQKMLMKNMESSRPNGWNQELWNLKNELSFNQTNHNRGAQQKPQRKLDLEQPAEEYIAESDGNGVLEIIDESEIELTLGPSSYNRRKKPETPLTSDSGPSFSSTSTGSSHINRTSSYTTRQELNGHEPRLVQVPDMTLRYQSRSRNNIDVEEQLRQDRLTQPSWFFQVLSLNTT